MSLALIVKIDPVLRDRKAVNENPDRNEVAHRTGGSTKACQDGANQTFSRMIPAAPESNCNRRQRRAKTTGKARVAGRAVCHAA